MTSKPTVNDGSRRVRLMWPDPSVHTLIRTREVALAYREAALAAQAQLDEARKILAGLNPRGMVATAREEVDRIQKLIAGDVSDTSVADLDLHFAEMGERWHVVPPDFVFDDDDWVPSWAAAEVLGMRTNTLGDHRGKGRIKGEWVKLSNSGVYIYRVGDVRALRESLKAEADTNVKGMATRVRYAAEREAEKLAPQNSTEVPSTQAPIERRSHRKKGPRL